MQFILFQLKYFFGIKEAVSTVFALQLCQFAEKAYFVRDRLGRQRFGDVLTWF